jgi:hypothetical protein
LEGVSIVDKYLFEDNGVVYHFDYDGDLLPISYIPPHNLSPYAKVKLEYMKEYQPEYVCNYLKKKRCLNFWRAFQMNAINGQVIYMKNLKLRIK